MLPSRPRVHHQFTFRMKHRLGMLQTLAANALASTTGALSATATVKLVREKHEAFAALQMFGRSVQEVTRAASRALTGATFTPHAAAFLAEEALALSIPPTQLPPPLSFTANKRDTRHPHGVPLVLRPQLKTRTRNVPSTKTSTR